MTDDVAIINDEGLWNISRYRVSRLGLGLKIEDEEENMVLFGRNN